MRIVIGNEDTFEGIFWTGKNITVVRSRPKPVWNDIGIGIRRISNFAIGLLSVKDFLTRRGPVIGVTSITSGTI